jgi:hypothetical protein
MTMIVVLGRHSQFEPQLSLFPLVTKENRR